MAPFRHPTKGRQAPRGEFTSPGPADHPLGEYPLRPSDTSPRGRTLTAPGYFKAVSRVGVDEVVGGGAGEGGM